MASNNPSDDKNAAQASSSSESLPRGLLGKGGTPVSKSTRLPSVRAARDLTLGGTQRKTFKPNIPVRPREKPSGNKYVDLSHNSRFVMFGSAIFVFIKKSVPFQ